MGEIILGGGWVENSYPRRKNYITLLSSISLLCTSCPSLSQYRKIKIIRNRKIKHIDLHTISSNSPEFWPSQCSFAESDDAIICTIHILHSNLHMGERHLKKLNYECRLDFYFFPFIWFIFGKTVFLKAKDFDRLTFFAEIIGRFFPSKSMFFWRFQNKKIFFKNIFSTPKIYSKTTSKNWDIST